MAYDINWHVNAGNAVLSSPQYQLYSQKTFQAININEVKASVKQALASNESAEVINYLCWLMRVFDLLAE